MTHDQSLDKFIAKFAERIAVLYPSNCANADDYIQAGHLKIAEIKKENRTAKNFESYAVTSVARAMRRAAVDSMCAVSAPHRVKARVQRVQRLMAMCLTEQEICQELNITRDALVILLSLGKQESLHRLFQQPTQNTEPFSLLDDLLSSSLLTDEDKVVIKAQFNCAVDDLGLTRNQLYRKTKSIRSKLIRSGYGIR
jgi:DNA-directed RNA polymerase specialized sigma subunit